MPETFSLNEWVFTTHQSLLGSEAEIAEAEAECGIHPSPEMFFVKSSVTVSNKEREFKLVFDPVSALRHCRLSSSDKDIFAVSDLPRLKVRVAPLWEKSRSQLSNVLGDIREVILDHDWTFTTNYLGDTTSTPSQSKMHSDEFLPVPLLVDQGIPILFYGEVVFWEDELHDNGCSKYSIRLRVTEKYWFILSLFSLKLEGVADRHVYTRHFHMLGSDTILREVRVEEKGWVFQDKIVI